MLSGRSWHLAFHDSGAYKERQNLADLGQHLKIRFPTGARVKQCRHNKQSLSSCYCSMAG